MVAVGRLGWSEIDAIYYESLDEVTRRVVEFDENSKRKQFTWQEEAKAIAEIHRLKQEKALQFGKEWYQIDTAKVLGFSEAKVSGDIALSEFLDNPRVSVQGTRSGALLTYKRELEGNILEELAKRRVEKGVSESNVILGDCLVELDKIEPESIDLVIIDPPWGVDIHSTVPWLKIRGLSTGFDDSEDQIRDLMTISIIKIARVMRKRSHIYMFFPMDFLEFYRQLMMSAGLSLRGRPLVWYKTDQPSVTDAYRNFLPNYEGALFGWKPSDDPMDRRNLQVPIPEAIACPRSPSLWHFADKPVELLKKFVETSSSPSELVLDCFAGGGSTLIAAASLGRRYIGIEKDQVSYEKCLRRLEKLKKGEPDVL